MATGRVERRLAAILAADVVGYSRLMERDEDRTLERLKAHRKEFIDPLIAEYQGRVVKLMGDGVLVEFASVVDAARCAVLIQRGMAEREAEVPEDQRLRFRIGINLGDVIHEADGDLYGDGVNVAARLEQLAEPGGVVVSGTAYDHLQGKLDLPLEFAGEQRVKNIERLVRAYRVRLDGVAIRFGSRRIRRLGRWAVATALGLFLLVVAAAGGWWWRQAGEPAGPALPDKPVDRGAAVRQPHRRRAPWPARRRHGGEHHRRSAAARPVRHRPGHQLRLPRQAARRAQHRSRTRRPLRGRGQPSG
jgi:class 3 adenylate cyclase